MVGAGLDCRVISIQNDLMIVKLSVSEATYIGVAIVDVVVIVMLDPAVSPGGLSDVSRKDRREGRIGRIART